MDATREALAQQFRSMCAAWQATIDDVLAKRVPLLLSPGGVATLSQRSTLTKARDEITNQVEPIGLGVIEDMTLSTSEVVARINEFARNYGSNLDAQIKIATSGVARNATFNGAVDSLMEAFGQVLAHAGEAAGELAARTAKGTGKGFGNEASPTTMIVVGAVALVALAYVVRTFR